jgi:hypothetical protein
LCLQWSSYPWIPLGPDTSLIHAGGCAHGAAPFQVPPVKPGLPDMPGKSGEPTVPWKPGDPWLPSSQPQ